MYPSALASEKLRKSRIHSKLYPQDMEKHPFFLGLRSCKGLADGDESQFVTHLEMKAASQAPLIIHSTGVCHKPRPLFLLLSMALSIAQK